MIEFPVLTSVGRLTNSFLTLLMNSDSSPSEMMTLTFVVNGRFQIGAWNFPPTHKDLWLKKNYWLLRDSLHLVLRQVLLDTRKFSKVRSLYFKYLTIFMLFILFFFLKFILENYSLSELYYGRKISPCFYYQ